MTLLTIGALAHELGAQSHHEDRREVERTAGGAVREQGGGLPLHAEVRHRIGGRSGRASRARLSGGAGGDGPKEVAC